MRLRILLIGAALAASAVVFLPSTASAFAWKDTCAFTIYNNTGSSQNVRPTLYTPFPPNTVTVVLYGVLAAAGVPTDKRPTFDNTGIPLTGGCTASLWFSNPGDNVKCSAAAPTAAPTPSTATAMRASA